MTANMKDDLFVGVTTWDSELLLDIVCLEHRLHSVHRLDCRRHENCLKPMTSRTFAPNGERTRL
jgi:hypothetical protein